MSEEDNQDLLNRPAGSVSLTKYRAHGSGMELFRAYVERRNTDRQMNLDRKTEVVETITPKTGEVVPIDVFERATSELVMIQILEELDPVIEDLLKFCENSGPKDDQLPNIRSALRIGDGRAPSDGEQTERKWAIQQRWIGAYLTMQETGVFRSENCIAREIARDFEVSQRTAINHWVDKKKAEPWQNKWAAEIAQRAKGRTGQAERPKKKAPPSKRRNRITFGKGRATR